MTNVNQFLSAKRIDKNELPNRIQQQIDYYENLLEDIDKTKEELKSEEDETIRKEIRQAIIEGESVATNIFTDIQNSVEEFVARKKQSEQKEADKLKKEEQAKNEAKPQGTPNANVKSKQENKPKPTAQTDDNKPQKKSMLGWVIGGTVLLLTLGAVNVLNRK
jgi:hypothetical protein